jgi:catechol 2,3-dioxygenase-like lactoylglutathione lyase family enzyme
MKKHYQGAAHIAVMTKDIDASIAFYEKIGGEKINYGELPDGDGIKRLALVDFAGLVLELIQPVNAKDTVPGTVDHFAVYVDDVDEAVAELKELGIDSFRTEEKSVLSDLFGGLENIFFTGPSGEQIELMKML